MFSTFEDIFFCLVLVAPIAVFASLIQKHWVDKELKKAFWSGMFAGVFAVTLVRIIYMPVEMYLGGSLRQFLSAPREWYISLIACIGVIGFVEEGCKALAAHIVCCFNGKEGFRPTFVFMSFAGSALSFSLMENIQYYLAFGPSIVLPRVMISSVAHLAFAMLCAYFSAKGLKLMKAPIKTAWFLNIGIILAAVTHGTFDYMIFQYSAISLNGIVISLVSLFIYAIYEIWIRLLKEDLPPSGFLAVCHRCRALTVDRIRFCPLCGNRVVKIDSLPTVLKL